MASPSPATMGQGSAGLVVKFPDGFQANVATIAGVSADPSANKINIQGSGTLGGAVIFSYWCYNLQEQILFLSLIDNAVLNGNPTLQLISLSPIPTNGDSANTDMFVNGLATAGLPTFPIAGKTQVIVTIGTIASAVWPPPIPPTALDVNACFRPDGLFTVNGGICYNFTYLNAVTVQFRLPPNPAGTYDLVYADSRGFVTKAGAITYA